MNTRSLEVDYCLNPRDLVDGFVSELLEIDNRAEFLVIITDPRNRGSMTIRSRAKPRDAVTMIHHAIEALLSAAARDAADEEKNEQE